MPSYTQNLGLVKGEKGATGPAGAAATIQIGTVTTGAAGSQAAVTNVGTENAAILNFTIPQGQQGVPGTTPSTDNFVTTDTDQTITGKKTFSHDAGATTFDTDADGSFLYLSGRGGLASAAGAGANGLVLYTSSGNSLFLSTYDGSRPKAAQSLGGLGVRNIEDLAYVSDLSDYVPKTRTINNKALSSNITITAADVGLSNVANERQYSASNPPPYPVVTNGTYPNMTVGNSSKLEGKTASEIRTKVFRTNKVLDTRVDWNTVIDETAVVLPNRANVVAGDIVVDANNTVAVATEDFDSGAGVFTVQTRSSVPIATTSVLGKVKSSTTGTTAGRDYKVQVNTDGTMKVNVPWTDNNTVTNIGANNANYTSGNINFVGSGATSVSKSGSTVTISSTNTTYSTFNRSSNGLVPTPGGSTTTRYLREDGTWQVPPNTNTDTKVTQTHSTTNANYPILLKNGTGTGNVTNTTLFDANVYVNPSTGTLTASKVYGAVFNDYAEYRKCETHINPGYIVTEDGNDCIKLCTTKKNKGKLFVVTDTYGTCIGEKINSVPVALTGRVLVHYDHKRNIKIGDYVGCNDQGQARNMSKIESFLHPKRVIGTVSSIPDYDTWGTDNVKVDGRIWVNLK